MKLPNGQIRVWAPVLIVVAFAFMYASVIWKLGFDWSTDENYSHGLLVPIVIAFIIWQRFDRVRNAAGNSGRWLGWLLIGAAVILLMGGTLASVLFAQRLSLLFMIVGVVVCLFGTRVLRQMFMPLVLLALAIPVPQLLFNKVAFPLQIFASRIAGTGLTAVGIAAERNGNVIEIPYLQTGETVSLEVVEACSGIRSLMTLITLALILGYFTRERRERLNTGLRGALLDRDTLRTASLMMLAVPVALITNAARVWVTGVIAYYFGYDGVEGLWHDLSGTVVFLAALILLMGFNLLLKFMLGGDQTDNSVSPHYFNEGLATVTPPVRKTALIFAVIVICGGFVNWLQYRGEVHFDRRPLSELPSRLGGWEQRNPDIRFDPETEEVLRASDYVMRDYYGPGKRLNLYVGYYASQRSGSTYHSPLSCLPGSGWEMTDGQLLEIDTPGGRRFTVNRYVIGRGDHKEYLIYWYQGRGRTSASEYRDKLYTSLDSVTKGRSDGGMIRIMTPFGKDAGRSLAAAIDFTGYVADNISEFLPD